MSDVPYPDGPTARTRWILARRPVRPAVDPRRPYAVIREKEPVGNGRVVTSLAVFLSNRECPWRCLMCDLWRHTLTESVGPGDIPAQIDWALREAGADTGEGAVLKLYNAGSFFDSRAIPTGDWEAVAARAARFERVVVECHPQLVGRSCVRFRDALAKAAERVGRPPPRLEVAMGLETAHPEVLEKLNKRMTLDDFRRAARFLAGERVALRSFVLVKPPFLDAVEALEWAVRSAVFAFEVGAETVSLIPVRLGNGALEALAAQGEFSPPTLGLLEEAQECVLGLGRGRVLADTWDLRVFASCEVCLEARRGRMELMNLRQCMEPRVRCEECGGGKWSQGGSSSSSSSPFVLGNKLGIAAKLGIEDEGKGEGRAANEVFQAHLEKGNAE